MNFDYYKELLNINNIPDFLLKYLSSPSLIRLKKIGYFCGMDYASKDVYDFPIFISRFDHSLTVALLVYKLTSDKLSTLAGLMHDISTPCFSHVIDYMNGDVLYQESTEEYTENIIKNDQYLLNLLKEDGIDSRDIINFKKYSIVDNERPKLCADRLDGIILTSIAWAKNITREDIFNIINSIRIEKNELGEDEIGFTNQDTANLVLELSNYIDYLCHTKEDNYMMMMLANITKLAINKGYLNYYSLYTLNEEELWKIFNDITDEEIVKMIIQFKTIKKDDIPNIKIDNIKTRNLKLLINGIRMR